MQQIRNGDEQRASIPPQYWVVGGEFRDTEFTALEGSAEALGPFPSYDEAHREWERRSVETKRHAHVRYTIVGNLPR
jgi:hypothetical protein